MLRSVSDDDFSRQVREWRMATPEQIEEARKQAPLPLAEALVKMGVITATQRESVEKKLEERPGGVGELGGCKLLKKIGEGGMGAVYLAEDSARKRKVALKVLPKKHASDPQYLQRFRREIEAATQLDHPNIVQAYSAGEDRGYHFYVMEYVEGESLRKRIERLKVLPVPDACALVRQIALGLRHAHEKGFVHRDVKPDNAIVTPAGVAKILDLGLAKNLEDTQASFRTVTGAALGTPHYISPEQARGDKDVDGRSDIYSLGATFYHLITGQVPFQGSSIFEIIQKHLMEQLPDPRDLRPEIPDSVVTVVRKMLAKATADRYPDCGAVVHDLERVAAKLPPLAPPLDPSLSSVAMPKTLVTAAHPVYPKRNPKVLVGAAAGLLLAGIVTYAVWPSPEPVKAPEPAKRPEPVAVVKKDPPKPAPEPEKTDPPRPKPVKPELEPPKPEPARPEPVKPEPEPPKPEPPKPEAPKPEPVKPEPEPPKPEPVKPAKAAIPAAAQVKTADAALREKYKDDFAKKSASDQAALAKKLLALEAPDPPAANYARLAAARDAAIPGGDAATLVAAVDAMAEAFIVDALALKTDALAAVTSKTTDGGAAIVTAAGAAIDEAVQADRYDLASRLVTKAKGVADGLKNDELKAGVASREKLVALLSKEFVQVSGSAKTLATKPDDGPANTAMGRFLCLVKEDWERGLPMLSKSSDSDWRSVAEKELQKSDDAGVQKDLCDGWIKLAEREAKGVRKDSATERARHWFTQVESKLLAADRASALKRLEALEKQTTPKPAAPRGAAAGAAPLPLQGNWLNLMPVVDVARHSVNGAWQRTADGLMSAFGGQNAGAGSVRFWIPYSPPEEYELILYVERLQGQEDLVVGLMWKGKPFAIAVDGWGQQGGGGFFNASMGQWMRLPGTPARAIPNNKVTRIGLFVRGGGFNMTVDGRNYLQINDMSQAGMPDSVRCLGQSDGFVIGSVRSVYRVSRIEFQPMNGGRGKVLR